MYISLYNKTTYSFLSSLLEVDDLIKIAIDNNLNSIAICDDNMYGVMEFITKCNINNLNPIVGVDFQDRLLFAKNYKGYLNLLKLISIQSEKEFVLRCRKRSLFDDIRLRECWNMNKTERPIVVEFLYSHFFYDSPITKQQLENNGINTSLLHSQQPYLISKEAYSNIIKDSQYEKDIFIS